LFLQWEEGGGGYRTWHGYITNVFTKTCSTSSSWEETELYSSSSVESHRRLEKKIETTKKREAVMVDTGGREDQYSARRQQSVPMDRLFIYLFYMFKISHSLTLWRISTHPKCLNSYIFKYRLRNCWKIIAVSWFFLLFFCFFLISHSIRHHFFDD
jgi:hypothetical protein